MEMEKESNGLAWHAIRVRSRCEKLAAAGLQARGFTVCAAVAPQRRMWIDRIRTVEMPLFPGYVFARFGQASRSLVVGGAGVAGVVGAGGVDLPLADEEIEGILTLLRSGAEVFHSPFIRLGARVRVRRGPLSGLEGILQQIKNGSQLVISVEFLRRSVAVQVDAALVEAVSSRAVDSDSLSRAIA
jgi:transcription antitermination factor NusG